jgi:hypothetical protein
MDPKFQQILSIAQPFIVSYPENLKAFNLSPWGHTIPLSQQFSCLHLKNEPFFDLLHTLDDLAFGPIGMPMDKWIFFDCAQMPGGIFGYSTHAKNLPEKLLKKFDLTPNYPHPVPISMFMAIPMVSAGHWFAHNICTANNFLKPIWPGLGLFTKVMALKVFNIETLCGATQWDSRAMNIHLQISSLELLSAYTPAHTIKKTLTYKTKINDEILKQALSGIPRKATDSNFSILSQNDKENAENSDQYYIEIQKRIEAGEIINITGRSFKKDSKTFFPATSINPDSPLKKKEKKVPGSFAEKRAQL